MHRFIHYPPLPLPSLNTLFMFPLSCLLTIWKMDVTQHENDPNRRELTQNNNTPSVTLCKRPSRTKTNIYSVHSPHLMAYVYLRLYWSMFKYENCNMFEFMCFYSMPMGKGVLDQVTEL